MVLQHCDGGATVATSTDRVTRFSADLVDDAARAGEVEQRSARQQLEHWARLGRGVSQRTTASRRRIEAVLDGTLVDTALTPEEVVVYDAEIDARVEERLARDDHVERRAAEGFTSVALDEHGRMVEYRPDGTTVVLDQ